MALDSSGGNRPLFASLVPPAWSPKSAPRRQLIRPFVRALSHLPGYLPVMKSLHNSPYLALRAQNHPHCLPGMRRYSSGILPQTPNESAIGTPRLVQPMRSMNGHYAAAGNKVARRSLYEVGRVARDSYISTRRMNPYSLGCIISKDIN